MSSSGVHVFITTTNILSGSVDFAVSRDFFIHHLEEEEIIVTCILFIENILKPLPRNRDRNMSKIDRCSSDACMIVFQWVRQHL